MLTKPLGDVIKVKSGDGIAIAHLREHDKYPVYGGNGINGYTSTYNVETDTMIIGRVGEKCGNVNITMTKSWVSDNALIVTPKIEYNNEYLRYLLEQTNLNNHANRNAQPVISGQIIYKIEVPYITDPEEQCSVGQMLQIFDNHIANLTELIEKKKGIRDGALEDLVSGRTRLKGFNDEWEEKGLLECVDLIQGLTYSPENVKPYGTLVLRSSNIQGNCLALDDNVYVDARVPSVKMIQDKDILICVRNGSSALIGKSCVLKEMPHTTFGAFMSVLRGDETGYISKVFESQYVQKQVRDRTNATINQITKKDFKQIRILLPSIPEQRAIADILNSLDAEIASLEEEKDKMLQIKTGAMDDLLTGRIRLTRQGG